VIARPDAPLCTTGEFSFSLPWPPKDLSPNTRQHWARLAKAKKKYRTACALSVLEQRVGAPAYRSIDVRLVFVAPDRRHRDRDNLAARMKAGLDGVCDAWAIDDKRFARVSAEIAETLMPAKGAAHVRVFISEHVRVPAIVIQRDADGMPSRIGL